MLPIFGSILHYYEVFFIKIMVPKTGIEPARMLSPQESESCVFTNFTTWARQ